MSKYIKLQNINKSYKNGDIENKVIKNIDLEIDSGEFVVIVGQSGSGKSTLLNIIGGLERVDSGQCNIGDLDLNNLTEKQIELYRKENVGYIFQSYHLLENLTVIENVNLMGDLVDITSPDIMLSEVGLSQKKNSYPGQLSGGEQQRVSIARALCKKPKLLLCDEPTGALDFETGIQVLELIKKIADEYECTVLLVTHNYPIVQIADRVIEMRSGEIINNKMNDTKITPKEIRW